LSSLTFNATQGVYGLRVHRALGRICQAPYAGSKTSTGVFRSILAMIPQRTPNDVPLIEQLSGYETADQRCSRYRVVGCPILTSP
jgi:hypothetical protein